MYKKSYNIQDILEKMVNGGLRQTRFRNSKFIVKDEDDSNNQLRPGKVIGTFSKTDLNNSVGISMGSVEALIDNHKELTHITPNVYRSVKRLSNGRMMGHREDNLKQINAFVVDFDGIDKSKYDQTDIALHGMEIGLQPTLILDTPNGYHVMFFLDKPVYVKRDSLQAVNMAKRISINLRNYYAEVFPSIDIGCNHFGYFRCPKEDNVLSYSPSSIHSIQKYLDFSYEFEGQRDLQKKAKKSKVIDYKQLRNIHEPWFHRLFKCRHINGNGGMIGRDNAVFTMSLHLYANNVEKEDAIEMMQKFNSNLDDPLRANVVVQKVNSAYSGRYKGANRTFIERLLYAWNNLTNAEKNRLFFRKHAKKREDRVRSHYSEWTKDVYDYVNTRVSNGGLVTTTATICKELGMARSTFNEVLRQSGTFVWHAGKGRNAKLKITTKKALYEFLQTFIDKTKERKAQYRGYLLTVLKECSLKEREVLADMFTKLDEEETNPATEGVTGSRSG